VLFVRATYIQQVLLDNRLYILRFAGCGVDEYRKNPRVSVGHVNVPGEVLRSRNSPALGMNTSLQFRFGAKTFEGSGLTKAGVDGVINKVRRNGRPTVIGDYALISQFTPWAGYVGSVNGNTITGVSDDIVNQLAATGALAMYNGAILSEMENPYNRFKMNADGDNFETIMPIGLGYVIPTGVTSPIATFTRGGLTTFSGNDVKTGQVLTRFDIEVGCDIAKGHEHEIGVIYDTALGGIN
jgi:hypothetical protein